MITKANLSLKECIYKKTRFWSFFVKALFIAFLFCKSCSWLSMSRFLLVKSKSWIAQALLYSLSSTFCHATCSIVLHSFLPICFRNVNKLTPFSKPVVVDVPIMLESCYHCFFKVHNLPLFVSWHIQFFYELLHQLI